MEHHTVNAGVLISSDTLAGKSAKARRYPDVDLAYSLIKELAQSYQAVIHYNSNSDRPLDEQIIRIFERDDIYSEGICRSTQLNIKKPDHSALRRVMAALPDLKIILQVPLWSDQFGEPQAVAEFIEQYSSCASYFILDPSGGHGTGISDVHHRIFEHIAARGLSLRQLVFAGGLCGDNVASTISRLRGVFGDNKFSIDAEGKLRGGKYAGNRVGDWLNPDKVRSYLFEAMAAFM